MVPFLSLHRAAASLSTALPHRPKRLARRLLPLVIAITFAGGLLPGQGSADEWTNLDGTRTVEGDFLGVWNEQLILRIDGRRIAIAKEKLNAASRFQAEELAKKKDEIRSQRMAELKSGDAKELSFISEAPTSVYQPLPLNSPLQASIEHTAKELQAGNIQVLWDALPASYQQDLDGLAKLMADSYDEKQFLSSLRILSQLARTMDKQREFLFAYPKMAFLPAEAQEVIGKAYTPVVGVFHVLGDPKTLSLENMKATPLQNIIQEKNAQLGPHLADLIALLPAQGNSLLGILDGSGLAVQQEGADRGQVTINDAAGQQQTTVFVNIEGRWIEETMVAQWKNWMTSAQQSIATQGAAMKTASSSSAILFTTVNATLISIEEAETQEEFNQILDQLLNPLMAQLSSLAQNSNNNPAGSSFGPGGMPLGGAPGIIPPGPGATPGAGGGQIGGGGNGPPRPATASQ